MPGRRPARLAEAIREEVAQMIAFELKDPRLGLVTVTRVEVSSDLGHARVYVGVLGEENERRKTMEALQGATGYVRCELGKRLRIYQVPEVDFRYDKGLEATERVARLLAEEQAASAARTQGPAEPTGSAAPEPAGGEPRGSDEAVGPEEDGERE